MAGMERRAHERRPLRTTVELLLPGRAPVAVRTTDISIGGIGLVVSANPPVGLEMDLRIPLPQPGGAVKTVSAHGRVQHSVFSRREEAFCVGLVFLRPSDSLLVAIGDYLGK